jgi:chromosomal replication initiation ATPase DnaA
MTPRALLIAIALAFGVDVSDLTGRSRRRHIAHARQAACWALHAAFPKLSQEAIGGLLGGLDHATVKYAIDTVTARLAEDAELLEVLRAVIPAAFGAPPPTHARTAIPRAMYFWVAMGRSSWHVNAA